MKTMLVYPGSAPATSFQLDNKLWLPDIVTYASRLTASVRAVCMYTALSIYPQPHCLGRYNSAQMERATYEAGAAWVRHDGRVHHSVSGLVDITCRHSRLSNSLTLPLPDPTLTLNTKSRVG